MKTNEVWRAVAVALYRALKVAVGGTGDGWQTGQGADASVKINAALQAHRDALFAELCAPGELLPGPMDSAPRDGKPFLAYAGGYQKRWHVVWWDLEEHHQKPKPFFNVVGGYGKNSCRNMEWIAWLPMPPAPKGKT